KRQALLALGAIQAQLTAVAQDRELVAVGSMTGEAPLEVARQPSLQLAHELLLLAGMRAGPVLERRLPAAPQLRGVFGKRPGQQRDRLRAMGAQRQRPGRELEVPSRKRGLR